VSLVGHAQLHIMSGSVKHQAKPRKASSATATAVICGFIASVARTFGIVPVCRALTGHGIAISPRTYHARRSRPPSRRAVRDAWLTALLRAAFEPDERWRRRPESLYGAARAWGHLRRQGIAVARCTVERLMRANGWRGNVRGRRRVRTTVPDPANPRHPDLVNRDFRASRPGELLVAGITYVPLAGGGFGHVAFVIDAFAGTIAGWECSVSKTTAFVQRAVFRGRLDILRPHSPPCAPRGKPTAETSRAVSSIASIARLQRPTPIPS